jgi:hypothetical protein
VSTARHFFVFFFAVSIVAIFFDTPDLRFAAWFLWMTPLLAALSSARFAAVAASVAASLSPAAAAASTFLMAVFS